MIFNMNFGTIRNSFLMVLAAIALLASCKKDGLTEDPVAFRLFRPTIKGVMKAEGNYIEVSWQKIKEASNYTVQLSRDTFKTIDATVEVDTNYVLLEQLRWNQLYQIQVRAENGNEAENSKWSYLGEIKTPKFPSIMASPTASDLQDNAVRVRWTNSGAPVTTIKVYNLADSSLVKEVALSTVDVAAQQRVVSGLMGNTTYIIYLYSDQTLRGWDNFTTKEPLTGTIVDLRDITGRPTVLFDTLAVVDAGSTILLARGQTYTIPSTFVFTKAVKIMSGSGFDGGRAILSLSANFDASGTIDYLRFEDLIISQGGSTQYFMNVGNVAKISEVSFSNCKSEGSFSNSFVRLKTAGDEITNLNFDNCVLGDFGIANKYSFIFANASSSAKVMDINITNSTFYKLYQFIRQDGVTTNSAVIDNCTFNDVVNQAGYFINYSIFPSTFTISNTIIGKTLDPASSNFIKKAGNPVFNNSYYTTDAIYSANRITDLDAKPIAYPAASTDLFQDPANLDFHIKHSGFAGKSSAGDPRWRP